MPNKWALALLISLCNSSMAVYIPIPVDKLGKPYYQNIEESVSFTDNVKQNSSYAFAQSVLLEHRHTNIIFLMMCANMGIGVFPLLFSKTDETLHLTSWGREYGRVRKLKDLLIASSSDYESGLDPLMRSNKSLAAREKVYSDNQKIFNEFYTKLQNDFARYSKNEMLSVEELKSLINRANAVGLMYEINLINKIIQKNSFSPLRWIILSGQLEDKVRQMEDIISERDQVELRLEEKMGEGQNDLLESDKAPLLLDHNLRKKAKPCFQRLYCELNKKIGEIENFNF